MRPAEPEKGVGIISASYFKDPTDEQWRDTADYKEWLAWALARHNALNQRGRFRAVQVCNPAIFARLA